MTVLFYTLGCKVNQYDTGCLREDFFAAGFTDAPKDTAPDVVVINTCTVTAESDRKGRQAIRRLAKKYPEAVIAVTGCMPQARPEKAEKIPQAHVVVGNALNRQLPCLVKEYLQTGVPIRKFEEHTTTLTDEPMCRDSFEGRTRAFVKIEDGCNRFCSYCLIPYARGRVRSKPLCQVEAQLKAFAEKGYKEVVLAGINLTAYGQEWGLCLADAVEVAQNIPEIRRIRLGSMEPDQFTPQMIERLAACDKLCPQFHLSLQSGSDTVLVRMNRHYDTAYYRDLVANLKDKFPGCAVTTDVMCGFPGESEEEFRQTLDFIEEIGFSKVHAFAYSPREGTPAAKEKNQVPPDVKSSRATKLGEVVAKTATCFMEQQIGTVQSVLLEQEKAHGIWEGHTPTYLPVRVKGESCLSGQIVSVKITEVQEDFCVGEVIL
jgi:threonylcarbamoyladenosine tRNA methylthiotransferase MtaB